jgi:hypothetical protein
MNNTNTGGPAFPRSESLRYSQHITGGMTLRDYFAAKALAGICANTDNRAYKSQADFAVVAYVLADAMLKEREQ